MCGIIGYVGTENAAPILLDGLARMEYRGYDSPVWRCVLRPAGSQVKRARDGSRCSVT